MKAIVYELQSPGTLLRREQELDERSLGPDDILAETLFSVVSTGTELAAWLGKPPLRPSTPYPRLVGYCNLGRVLRVPPGAKGLRTGDVLLTHQSHRSAFVCTPKDILWTARGLPDPQLRKITATYLYHLGSSALPAGGCRPGSFVAIVGAGTLGLATAELVRASGGRPLLFSNQDFDAAGIRAMGFTHLFRKDHAPGFELERLTGSNGVDLIVNTSDKWSDHLLCLKLVRKGGEIVCLGFPGRGEPPPDYNPLDSQYFYDKQIRIRAGGQMTDREFADEGPLGTMQRNIKVLSSMILEGRLDPGRILNLARPWTDLEQIYQALASRTPGVFSAILTWKS